MNDAEFTAYVQGLPPQDRRTVEQALAGLRQAMHGSPRTEAEADGKAKVRKMLDAVRDLMKRERPRAFGRNRYAA